MLLDGFGIGLGKEAEQDAAEVVRVAVGVAQLVGDGVDEQITSLRVQIDGQILEDVDVGRMADGGHGRSQSFRLDRLDGLRADVQHQRVQQRQIVSHSRFSRYLITEKFKISGKKIQISGEKIRISGKNSNFRKKFEFQKKFKNSKFQKKFQFQKKKFKKFKFQKKLKTSEKIKISEKFKNRK